MESARARNKVKPVMISDDLPTDKSDFIDDSEDLDDLDSLDGSCDPTRFDAADDSDISSSDRSDVYSPINSVYDRPFEPRNKVVTLSEIQLGRSIY